MANSWNDTQGASDEISHTEWNEMTTCILNISSNAIQFSSNATSLFANSSNAKYPNFISSQSMSSNSYKGLIDKIGISIDGGGDVIPSGIKGDSYVPYNCRIEEAISYATPSGSIYIDIWKDTTANYPPTDADSICGDQQIVISSNSSIGIISSNNTLSGWTTSITAGDILRFRVSAAAYVTKSTVNLTIRRT